MSAISTNRIQPWTYVSYVMSSQTSTVREATNIALLATQSPSLRCPCVRNHIRPPKTTRRRKLCDGPKKKATKLKVSKWKGGTGCYPSQNRMEIKYICHLENESLPIWLLLTYPDRTTSIGNAPPYFRKQHQINCHSCTIAFRNWTKTWLQIERSPENCGHLRYPDQGP